MAEIIARFKVDWPGFTLDVDLTLPGTGVTAIFGRSGSGKTTLLRAIAGLERTQQGFLSFNGEVWQDAGRFLPVHKRPLGYVFQEASLFSHLSVRKNLRFGLQRCKTAEMISLDQVVELLGIGHLLERKADCLSGGERQMLSIARGLMSVPKLILVDEPSIGLAPIVVNDIFAILQMLNKEGYTILLSEQNAFKALKAAHRGYVLETGSVTLSGTAQQLLNDPGVKAAYLGA